MAFGAMLSNLTDVELFRMMHRAGLDASDEILDSITDLDEMQLNLPRICAICSSAMKGLAYAGAYASAYEGSESICGSK
jgi:hypothetical protein